MRADSVTLVVGTTPDYIDWIRREHPGAGLFLTDPAERESAEEDPPTPAEEILCDLSDHDAASRALDAHLDRFGVALAGIASFDCESLGLAASLAREHRLCYHSAGAVERCRDKERSKHTWRRAGLRCPAVARVATLEDVLRFAAAIDGPVVIKPARGSGSELVFACRDEDECRVALAAIRDGLEQRADRRLYREDRGAIVEELVEGEELSCDFVVDHRRATLVRLTRKLRDLSAPFGTTRAYSLIASLPEGLEGSRFEDILLASAQTLGISWGLCMLDFVVRGQELVLLELTPRPGGDCLPWLLAEARGLDVLGLNLDLARGERPSIPDGADTKLCTALRFHASRSGVIESIDDSALSSDPRVRSVRWIRCPGHVVRMPPDDYDSWLLGHAIFVPDESTSVAAQCRELTQRVRVEIRSRT